MILKSNKDLFLLRLSVEIINKRDILKIYLIIQIMLRVMKHAIEFLIKEKTKSDACRYNIKYIIY